LGSSYAGLFGVCNDSLCFLPEQIDKKNRTAYWENPRRKNRAGIDLRQFALAVFAKMNNKQMYLPSFVSSRELEVIEREIKAKVLSSESAFGNLAELNDAGAVVSSVLEKKAVDELKKVG